MGIFDIFRSRKNNHKENIAVLIAELEQLGYYNVVSGDTDEIKRESISAGYPYGWEESGRDFSADAEELAEGGVGELIISAAGFLNHEGISITGISDHLDENGYTLALNNQNYLIYNQQEMKKENLWEIAAWRTIAVINRLLSDAGSQEKCYYIYGGNDMRIVLLPDVIYGHIQDSILLPDTEKPKQIPEEYILRYI